MNNEVTLSISDFRRIIDSCEDQGIVYTSCSGFLAETKYNCAWYLIDERLPPDIESTLCPCGGTFLQNREEDLLLVGCILTSGTQLTPRAKGDREAQIQHLLECTHRFLLFALIPDSKPYPDPGCGSWEEFEADSKEYFSKENWYVS